MDTALKHCGGCDQRKSRDEFHRNKNTSDGFSIHCRNCQKARAKAWYHTHIEYMRAYRRRTIDQIRLARLKRRTSHPEAYKRQNAHQNLRKKYGITIDQYMEMKAAQNYRCLICGVPDAECVRQLSVDHDHKTGKIRGLLCVNCNKGMGHFHDDPELLKKAILYLEAHLVRQCA